MGAARFSVDLRDVYDQPVSLDRFDSRGDLSRLFGCLTYRQGEEGESLQPAMVPRTVREWEAALQHQESEEQNHTGRADGSEGERTGISSSSSSSSSSSTVEVAATVQFPPAGGSAVTGEYLPPRGGAAD